MKKDAKIIKPGKKEQDSIKDLLPSERTVYKTIVKYGRQFLCFIRSTTEKLIKGLVDGVVGVVTLRNSGKWISVLVISVVLYLYAKFLHIQGYSIESFTLVKDGLVTLGSLVFGVVGGVRGATTLIDKVGNMMEKRNGVPGNTEEM